MSGPIDAPKLDFKFNTPQPPPLTKQKGKTARGGQGAPVARAVSGAVPPEDPTAPTGSIRTGGALIARVIDEPEPGMNLPTPDTPGKASGEGQLMPKNKEVDTP